MMMKILNELPEDLRGLIVILGIFIIIVGSFIVGSRINKDRE